MKSIVLIHCMVVILYAVVMLPFQKRLGAAKAVVAICMPFVGVLFLLLSDVAMVLKKRERFDYSLLLFEDDTEIITEYEKRPDELLVPVGDALYSSNAYTKRKVVLNILKKDVQIYANQLKTALGDDDTETAHYAAAALVEMKGEYEKKVEGCLLKINDHLEEPKYSHRLIAVLFEYINLGILDFVTEKRYRETLIGHAQNVLRDFGDLPFDCYFWFAKTAAQDQYALSGEILTNFMEAYSGHEEPYALLLDFHYRNHDKRAADRTLDLLGRSDAVLSQRMLELVRFYRNGDEFIEI